MAAIVAESYGDADTSTALLQLLGVGEAAEATELMFRAGAKKKMRRRGARRRERENVVYGVPFMLLVSY